MFYKLIFNGNDKRKKIDEETKTFSGLAVFAKKVFNLESEDVGFLFCGTDDVSSYEISCDEDLEYVLEAFQAFNSKSKFIEIKVIENFEMSPENPDRFSMAGESEIKKMVSSGLVENPVLPVEEEVKEEEIREEEVKEEEVKEEEVKEEEVKEEEVKEEEVKEEEIKEEEIKENKEESDSDGNEIEEALNKLAEKIKDDYIENVDEDKKGLLESRLSNILNETIVSIKEESKIKNKGKNKNNKSKEEKIRKQQIAILNKYKQTKEKFAEKIDIFNQKLYKIYEKLNEEFKQEEELVKIDFLSKNEEDYETVKTLESEISRLLDVIRELEDKIAFLEAELGERCNEKEVQTKNQVKTIHYGIVCDMCGKNNFVGKRFKCMVCVDFDICETCEHNEEHDHPMIRMTNKAQDHGKLEWVLNKFRAKPFFKWMFNLGMSPEETERLNKWREKKNRWMQRGGCPFKRENKSNSPNECKPNIFRPFFGKGFGAPFWRSMRENRRNRRNDHFNKLPETMKNTFEKMGVEIIKAFDPKKTEAPKLNKDEILVEIKVPQKEEKEDFVINKEEDQMKKENNKPLKPENGKESVIEEAEEISKEELVKNKKIEERKDFVKAMLKNCEINDEVLHYFVICNLNMEPADFFKAIEEQKKFLIA